MQETQDLIRIRHIANPRIPCCVCKSITKAGKSKDDDEHGVRWMDGDDNVGDEVTKGRDDGDTLLSVFKVDGVIQEGGSCIADQRGEEDEGDYNKP